MNNMDGRRKRKEAEIYVVFLERNREKMCASASLTVAPAVMEWQKGRKRLESMRFDCLGKCPSNNRG